jgi:hypothetical protein
MLSVVTLNVVMLSVLILTVDILSVMTPSVYSRSLPKYQSEIAQNRTVIIAHVNEL